MPAPHHGPRHDDASDDPARRRSVQHGGGTVNALGRQLADLARELHHQQTPDEVLDRIVTAAVALVPGAQEATISRVRHRSEVTAVVATSERAASFDDLQQELGEGPCLEALFDQRTIRVDELATETRWPGLARHAGELGIGSTLCFQLYVQEDNLGALNLLSERPQAFDDESEDVGQLLASHAAIALADTQQLTSLHLAMDSRDLIGQAKGILMARRKITAEQAFAVLVRHSQDTNRKLRDVAADVAGTGQLDR